MDFIDQTFSDEHVDLDFNRFEGCTFENCTMVYHGFGAPYLKDNTFVNVRWNFADAAGNTMKFLSDLYQNEDESQQVVDALFEKIKKGTVEERS